MRRKSGDAEMLLFGERHQGHRALGTIEGQGDPGALSGEMVLRVYLRSLSLKRLFRQGWLKRGLPEGTCESVADHSFGTALLALLIAGRPPFEKVERERAALMALVHELCEVYAGDITPSDGVAGEEKKKLERASLSLVLEDCPEADFLAELWEDFEEEESPEARLVKQLDRLEMGIQAAVYRAEGAGSMEEFITSAQVSLTDGYLRDILALAIDP